MQCPSCGQSNADGSNFCAGCGGSLAPVPDTASDADHPHVDSDPTIVFAPQSSLTHPPSRQPPAHQPPTNQPPPAQAPIAQAAGVPIYADGGELPYPHRRTPSTIAKVLIGVASLLLVIAGALLVAVMLRDDGDRTPPSQASLDAPELIVNTSADGSGVVAAGIDFAGSVDNIALYANGMLVDQAGSLGGQLVWRDAPAGTHSMVLRSQTGDLILIGAPNVVTVGADQGSSGDVAAPDDTSPDTTSPDGTTETTLEPTTVPPTTAAPTTGPQTPPATLPVGEIGPYVAVLASLPKATTNQPTADSSGARLAAQLGIAGHRIVDSDNWASLRDGFWVVVTPENFPTVDAAAAHCWALGARTSSTCFGRPVTQNPADLTVVAPPAP